MCGIAGGFFWRAPQGHAAAEASVATMVEVQGHRGPDGHGVYSSSRDRTSDDRGPLVVLGHNRLAILDVSAAGAQPMGGGGERPWVTYNGETYNFLEVRKELEELGVRFTSRTDTEVLLRGYDIWGADVLQRLRGMFAFALWDPAAGRLLLARDRLGIKPLYYYAGDGYLLFASEVRTLLATGLVPRRLNATALWHYLGYQSVPAPFTLVDGVRMLEPGHVMTVSGEGQIATREYWNLLQAAGNQPADLSPEAGRRRVGELLREAVAGHMISDVPVGAFLSGGIDSSAVVALMREAGHTPRTFSIGFAEHAFDESAHAQLVATMFRTEHTHIELGDQDLLDQLPDALQAMDQPTGDGVNTYVISKAVHEKGMKVALSGLGGDEVFGGYPSFARLARIADAARLWGRSPAAVRNLAATAVRALGRSSVAATKAAAVLESDGSLSSMFLPLRQVLSLEQREQLFDGRVLESVDRTDPYQQLLATAFENAPDSGVYGRVSFAESRTYMHDVLLRDSDQMSMAHGLEIRVPLVDHLLVEQVTALPDSMKEGGGVPKRLLVESLGGLLPDSIVHRPKQGFTFPFEVWMRGALRPLCEARLGASGLAGRGLFRPSEIHRLWTSFLEGGKDVSWARMWILVVLDSWLDHHGLSLEAPRA